MHLSSSCFYSCHLKIHPLKNLFTLTLLLFAFTAANSQAKYGHCGTTQAIQNRNQLSPGYAQRVNAAFDNAVQLARANKASRSNSDTIYKVKLVFHVVYLDTAGFTDNIPDSVIQSQVEILNEDYRRLNRDTDRTRSEFLPVAGDAGIEFELATIDPDGNPTNGITRTVGNPGFLGFSIIDENMKKAASGKAAWPTDRYVNVWVCDLLGGIGGFLGVLGYAYPPANAPNWPAGQQAPDSAVEGVVLHYAVVGRNFSNPIDNTVAGGRSLVHELGHYFGMRHIWGDETGCADDDGISDTPRASDASQQTCDTVINSCVDAGPTDFPDMIENYMDYSDDRCLNMFTVEQIGIMRAMLQTSRAGVATVEIRTATGIKPEENFTLLQVYPNPSNGMVYLNAQVKNGYQYSYEIYNAIGEKLAAESELTSSSSQRAINLSAQPSGIYFAKITSGAQVVVKKFQIQQ